MQQCITKLAQRLDDLERSAGMPSGVIVASAQPCKALGEKHWETFDNGSGRFLLGANPNAMHGLSKRDPNQPGGDESFKIETRNLPKFALSGNTDKTGGNVHVGQPSYSADSNMKSMIQRTHPTHPNTVEQMVSHTHTVTVTSAPEMIGAPLAFMPPYFVVYFCRRR